MGSKNKSGSTANLGTGIDIDIQSLVDTRLLIQANSGGGKSYAIRKLLEQTHGRVQQIVLDIEGDFSSLRENYDYLIAGKGGDIPAEPRSAELLAIKVLELKADIIIDLYELKQHERIRFVKLFLDAMVNAPKDLWHPVLVVLDEAHIFCPEKGSAESMGSVIDICTRGRKRGYCPVLATQRISKLHKDAAAECNNKLIGRTGLDIDMKRAADELGLPSNTATFNLLRNMKPGEFYVFGPAISREVTIGKVDKVETTHAKAGQRGLGHKPPPSASIKAKLAKLADLPEAAAEEIRDRSALQARIKELERELKAKPKPELDKAVLVKAVEAAKKDFEKQMAKKLGLIADDMKRMMGSYIDGKLRDKEHNPKVDMPAARPLPPPAYVKPTVPRTPAAAPPPSDGKPLGQCERKILGFLCVRPQRAFSKVQVAAMTGYAHSSGGFNNALSRLTQGGYISRNNGSLQIADVDQVRDFIDGTPHTLQDWVNKLGACERKIYELLLAQPDENIARDDVAQQTGYAAGSGGFNNALSRLNTLGLIERQQGYIKLNPAIKDL